MANAHNGHRSRVRERVRKEGLTHFQDYQVLEYALTFVIPYKDTNVLAHNLINKFGSFSGVLEADEDELSEVDGMGEVSAHFLSHLLKIHQFYEMDKAKKVQILKSPQDSINYVKPFFKDKMIEELYLICVTPLNKIVSVEKICEGSASESPVCMRNIIDKMGRAKVSNAIVAHNHPKGTCSPSESDDKFTRALTCNLAMNGCFLLDHIIIGENEQHYSYRQSGLIDRYREEVSHLVAFGKIAQPEAKYEVDNDKK